jgi:hypothetical protein
MVVHIGLTTRTAFRLVIEVLDGDSGVAHGAVSLLIEPATQIEVFCPVFESIRIPAGF